MHWARASDRGDHALCAEEEGGKGFGMRGGDIPREP